MVLKNFYDWPLFKLFSGCFGMEEMVIFSEIFLPLLIFFSFSFFYNCLMERF